MAHVLLDTRFPAEQQAYLAEQCESVIIMDETDMEKLNPESINCVLSYGHTKIDAAFLDRFRLRGVRVVSNFGTGYDHIDVESIMQEACLWATPQVLYFEIPQQTSRSGYAFPQHAIFKRQ